jgi:subtilisin-like proprotein convertase family protein
MHYKFTLKNMGRFLRTLSILLVLACTFAGTANAQCAWTSATVFPTTTLDMPVATVGTNMYSFGGVQNGALPTASYKFDGTAWTAIANLPQGLEFASATTDGTNIFVIGGASSTGVPLTTNYRYNVATNTYTNMASCATGTWAHAAVFLSGKIYKIGGNAAAGASTAVEIYDVAGNTWTTGAAYPAANGFIGAVAIGGYIYAAGGINTAGTNKTYRYDPAANTWDDAAIADMPASRWGAAAAPYRGFAMAGGYAGGDATANITTSLITWDPATNTWTTGAAMPGERSRFTGAILNDAFYVVGGRSVASAAFLGSNNNYKLTCPPVTACSGTPAPGNTFATSSSVCSGTPTTLSAQNPTSGGGVTYQWQTAATLAGPYSNAPGASTNPTYTVSPTATGFYRVQVICGGNTGTSTPIQITVTLCTCLTPDAATICEGTIQSIKVNGTPITGSVTAASGPINVAVPDSDPTGVTSGLSVTLPAGAVVTSAVIGFDMTHTYVGDMRFNLVAPNGQILNLFNAQGAGGDNFIGTFVNTSLTTPTFASSAAPYTSTYAPDAAAAVGPTGSISNATPATFFTPGIASGTNTWTLAMVDIAGGDVGNLTGWSIKLNYSIFPTATWTGGAMFTNPAATTPYVAGSQANTVYVQPTATTTYTANIAAGPCAGANNVTVTVIPRPVITVSPASGCGPLTITASGATTYSWTPGAGLNNTTGATVIANPTSTTTYSVTGIGNTGCTSLPLTALVNSAPTASVISAVAGSTFQLNEAFTGAVPPTGWTITNLSNPVGITSWFKPTGTPPFPSHSGGTNDYAGANYQNTTTAAAGDISDWFISPVVNIKNGDEITFWTRTTDISPLGNYADRLQVRISTAGTSVNVGANSTSTGDFTGLLLDINPTLQATGVYPNVWTRFVATVTGVTGTVPGRFAFRYFVTNGGGGANSDFIGVDDVSYSSPATVNCANTVTNIKVDITGGVGPYTVVFSNGTTSTTVPNYTSGSNIQVSPAATTTYTVVSVTGANGCTGTGNTGSAVISITPPASVTTQPAATSACVGGNATISVAAGPVVGNTYQWQVSTNGGTTYTNITNNATYGGATTNTLTITGATAAMANNSYRVVITGSCGAAVTSSAAVLTVNTPAVITTQPVATFVTCAGNGASISVAATGNQLTYQWQVSTDGGTTYANIANGANYSGVTTNTLTFVSAALTFINYKYRVQVTTAGCALVNSTAATLTAINPVPVVVISVSPSSNVIPGSTVTLTAAVSPNAAATYQWYNNGVPVAGATANTLVVGVDGVGTYTIKVTDINGCSNIALASTPASLTVGAAETTQLFIYPSPNSGKFQVRYFNDLSNGQNGPAIINVYDSKASRVFTRRYILGPGYQAMQVDLASHGKGIYRVDLLNTNGERIKTGNVMVY